MRTALALLLIALPMAAAKGPTVAQLTAQVNRLTQERDELKQRLASTENLQQELAGARKAQELATAQAEAARKEAERLRSTLAENQGGADSMLQELQAGRQALATARQEAEQLKGENATLKQKLQAAPAEGDLVHLEEGMVAARPINLNRVTPRIKSSGLFSGRPRGAVVVNVLVSEKGDVLAARLVQGLPADAPDARIAEEACLEAAKRIVFDPATSKDGQTRFKVWQGVGFFLD